MAAYIAIIYFVIYFIYVLSFFIDLGIVGTYQEQYGILFAIIILMIFILILSIFITLYIDGNDVLGVSGFSMFLIWMFFIILLGLVLYYQYVNSTAVKNNIIHKVNSNPYMPIYYQYGHDSQEIARRLSLNNNDIISVDNPVTLQSIWETLMIDKSNTKIAKLMHDILGSEFKDSIDIHYNLLWYLCISEDPFRNGLNRNEIRYLLGASSNELRELAGSHYIGDDDRASLIFAILSGQLTPTLPEVSRYNEIKNYDPIIIYNLAFIQNVSIDHNNARYQLYPPHKYLSMQSISSTEQMIINVSNVFTNCQNDICDTTFNQRYDELIDKLGIGPINNIEYMTDDDKLLYLQSELSSYNNVFNREFELMDPPDLHGKTRDQAFTIMSQYTNVELIDAYEPRKLWNSRVELFKVIYDDIIHGAKWSLISLLNCNNDDTINVISGDIHGKIDKHDSEDPTLSYGIQKNYRCFQVSELTEAFTYYDDVFMFRIPDWTVNTIDPITRAPLIREFPMTSIKELKALLEKEQYHYNDNVLTPLINKIQEGLDIMKSANMQVLNLKNQIRDFSFEQKNIIELYLAWMFNYSMWMRFWKGPGYPWPMSKVSVTITHIREREQRSSPTERDEYVFIQEGVRTAIIEIYEKDKALKDWIMSLPTIYYDFETQEASCATHNIITILDQIALGSYCMGFGSDTILKTAYYYITNLLDQKQGSAFDDYINRMMTQLTDIEYTTVTNQLNNVHTSSFRTQLLNRRFQELQKPLSKQLAFDPSKYQNNVHVD